MSDNVKKRDSIVLPGIGGLVLSGGRPILAIILAFAVSAVMIVAQGANPFEAYWAMLRGSFGSVAALAITGVRAAPLLLGGLGVALSFKAGLLNVGIEGQIYVGGSAAAAVGIMPLPVPPWLHLILAVSAGFLGGVVWGLIPAYLKAYRGISEIVTTLMLNYVGIQLCSLLVHEPSPLAVKGAFFPQSPPILPEAQLPIMIKGTSLHIGIIIGIVAALIIFFVLQYTPFGMRTRMTGQNPEAARYAGVNVKKQIAIVLLLSCGLGGLAGTGEVLGLKLRLFDYFSGGLGYDSIAVALIANSNPIGVIFSAFFFGALRAGAGKMETAVGIKAPIVQVIQALAVLFVIMIGFAEYTRTTRREKQQEQNQEEA
ncbi:MAG: ABC transporter permease [Anaerolineales bacterium]|nr:ABC transporter permease [Anaerolineales bacterium]